MNLKSYKSFNFIHIPKCGGTSFRKLLADTCVENEIQDEEIYIVGQHGISNNHNISQLSEDQLNLLKKRTLRVIGGHHKYNEIESYGIFQEKEIFRYTILRHPVERFVSHYNFFHYKLNYHNCGGIKLNDLNEKRLRQYVKLYENLLLRYIGNVERPKAVGVSNIMKISLFNLFHDFGAYGILEYPNESQMWLKKETPDWLTLSQGLPRYNQNKVESNLKDVYLEIIQEGNQEDITFYQKAVDFLHIKSID